MLIEQKTIGVFMKKIVALLLLLMSSSGYANCMISSVEDDELLNLLSKHGWSFENYEQVCQELKKHNLGVIFKQTGYISNYQSTVSTSIHVYPLEIKKKYNEVVPTALGAVSISVNPDKTKETIQKLRYKDANTILNDILTDQNYWQKTLDQVAFIRKHIK